MRTQTAVVPIARPVFTLIQQAFRPAMIVCGLGRTAAWVSLVCRTILQYTRRVRFGASNDRLRRSNYQL